MFLSTILLKLSGVVNGHYWTLSCLFCNKVAIFMQFSAPMEAYMPQKEQRNVFMVMKCFCLQNNWNIRHPINRLLHIDLHTSDVPMPHFNITAPKYGGLYRAFCDILKTQFLSIFLVIRVQKWKLTGMLWCKLSALSKHVKLYDKLWISVSGPHFLLNPQTNTSTLYSYILNVGICVIK